MRHSVLVGFFVLLPWLAGAAPADLGPELQAVRDQHKVPALAGAIVDRGRLMAVGAVGVRKLNSPATVTVEDQFHLGSCTKAMTATLCAMLVEQGKLRWDTTLGQVFPELKGRMDAQWQGITLEQLLTHRAGLPEDRTPTALLGKLRAFDDRPERGRQFLLEQLIQKPLENKPGSKFAYSNYGYALAGHMAERVMGKPYEQLLRERLFAPLGMKSAGFGPPGERGSVKQPWGHDGAGKPLFQDNPLAITPGGCVHSSIGDWAKFVALHSHPEGGPAGLLKADSLERLHRLGEDHEAMGWFGAERDWAGGMALTHSGTNTMWYAVAWVAPKRDFAVLVVCNQGGEAAAKACDQAAYQLILKHARLAGH